jgi:hypothetical protein
METLETIENTINTMAELAAKAAVEAFGTDQPATASDAYEFICQLQYDNEADEEYPHLTDSQFCKFQHDYCRWLRNNGVSVDVATKAAFR